MLTPSINGVSAVRNLAGVLPDVEIAVIQPLIAEI